VIEVLLAFIGRADNVAILVLTLALSGCGYLHLVWRREDREDRQKLYATLEANTRALEGLRNVLSASLGKPL